MWIKQNKFIPYLIKITEPRRFGKSLLVSTLEAALEGKKELFEGLWIADSDYFWIPQGVIRFDFSELSIESAEEFKESLSVSIQEIADKYEVKIKQDLNVNSAFFITWKTQRFVIELKIYRQKSDILDGLEQTASYMDKTGATEGHLVIFDRDTHKSWQDKIYHRTEKILGKAIEVWGM